jgi:hypothetical protein
MGQGPWRWVVLFFTRPIALSDLTALARPLRRREKATVGAKPAAPADEVESRPSRPRSSTPGPGSAQPRVISLRAPALEVGGVSEQPLDTLPAELQSEFRNSGKGALDPPRSGAGGAAG